MTYECSLQMIPLSMMYSEFFEDCHVKPAFSKEFISLWQGWVGEENLHCLDNVTEQEWSRFNDLLRLLAEDFLLERVNSGVQALEKVDDIENVLSTHKTAMSKDSSHFTQLVIPELGCVITEDWDYTYILWHKNNGAL